MKKALLPLENLTNVQVKGTSLQFFFLYVLGLLLLMTLSSSAATKVSIASGNWENSSIWNPAGVPATGDNVVIGTNTTVTTTSDHTVQAFSVLTNGQFTIGSAKRFTINGNLDIDGTMNMNKGMITLSSSGRYFKITSHGTFIWDPSINTSAEATLFTNSTEQFDIGSTLVIKQWYNYTSPLAQDISGNFGNVEINSPGGNNSIVEWNQQNQFELHKIFGTLTIDQGWVTLDKSGNITNTTIGNIVLKNLNSTFYAHNGTHGGSFSLHCSNITNTGGTFYGLNDGNGNVTIHTTGNFVNSGNVKIINNSGVINVSNGNATLNIEGIFAQNSGDCRIIYNTATTTSGVFNATFGTLLLNGGIFMGQTACHTSNQQCSLFVTNDFKIDFRNSNDKFRGTSLSSIGGVMNNTKMNLNIGGNFTVDGIISAEVTSAASSGQETINVGGNLEINGCNNNFNYGTLAASHAIQMIVANDFNMKNGQISLSRNNGPFAGTISRKLNVSGGNLVIKSQIGSATLDVVGGFNQTSGNIFFHNNSTTPTSDGVVMSVSGVFNQSSGLITMDDNPSSTSNKHVLKLKADSILLSGDGIITRNSDNNIAKFGTISFQKAGTSYFKRTGTNHLIESMIQKIESRCTVSLVDCPFQIGSTNQSVEKEFYIGQGGRMEVNNGQIISNGQFPFSRIYIDSTGVLALKNTKGVLDASNQCAISTATNMALELHANSVVEYNSRSVQYVSGIPSQGNYSTSKYGILRINMQGNPDLQAIANSENLFVRTKLDLTSGALALNNKSITIENGRPDGIIRNKGYIISESNLPVNSSIVKWQNLTADVHTVPFGTRNNEIIPVTIKPTSGIGREVAVSTRKTSKDNRPYPALNMTFPGGNPFAQEQVIDRWWSFNGPGVKADITLTYRGIENSINTTMATELLNIIQWTGSGWNITSATAFGSRSQTGTISISGSTLNPDWTIASVKAASIDINADKKEDAVTVNWHIQSETGIDHFVVERSQDGSSFIQLGTIMASFDGKIRDYAYDDLQPSDDMIYYRLKQVAPDGSYIYSKTVKVQPANLRGGVSINSVSPNPFSSNIEIKTTSAQVQDATVMIVSSDGKIKYEKDERLEIGENDLSVSNLDALQPGSYILIIQTGKERITKKIIKN